MTAILCPQALDISGRIRIVDAGNHQPGIWHSWRNRLFKGLNQHLATFVRAPFAEGQDAMLRIATAREVRKLRARGKNSMGAEVNIFSAILLDQRTTVCRQQY